MQGNVVDNRYDVVKPLGSGGMGEVYLARDRILDRDVALKILRSPFARDAELSERFKREAQSAAALSHPNVVQVYDRGDTADHSSYIAMEYVPGGTLKDRINEEGPLPYRLAASFGYQVAEALGAAHEKGLVHRDIKPQNVLITQGGQAKVADFGIARAVSAATGSQTRTGTILGTAGYMSPEQALGEPATPKSDLYSLGVVLYEALTGEQPFTADNPVAVSMKHVTEVPRPPRELNPAVPEAMNAVVMRLLAKDPDERYPDAEALAEDLWRCGRGGGPAAPPRAEAATVEAPRPARTTRRAGGSPRQRRKRQRGPLILLALLLLLLGLLGTAWVLRDTFLTTDVPGVEGLQRARAVREIEQAGLEAEVRTRQSGDANAGVVIDQSPGGGRSARRGSTVALTVGAGAANVTVPNVLETGFDAAAAELQNAGLAVGTTYDVPSDVAAGVVLEQGVAAGTGVPEGTPVDLGLSTGPAPTTPASSASASATQDPTTPNPAPSNASASPQGGQDPGVLQNDGAGGDEDGQGRGRGRGRGRGGDPPAGDNGGGED